jgi:hypothetical protein
MILSYTCIVYTYSNKQYATVCSGPTKRTYLEVQYNFCIIITEKNDLKTPRDYCTCKTQFCKS